MTDSPYATRPLTAEDAAPWSALRRQGTRDHPLGFLITPEEADATSDDDARAILQGGTTRGVFHGATLVGYCGLRRGGLQRIRHRAELGPFMVNAAHQGRGAAGALMTAVIAEARAMGVAQLELHVDVDNARAFAFYRRHGFVPVAILPDGARIEGRPRDAHFCVLRLEAEA